MARKIIGDQLRYGDIEAAYSEPNYLGTGIGLLGVTIHDLVSEDKSKKEKSLDERKAEMAEMLSDGERNLRALQNRNLSYEDKFKKIGEETENLGVDPIQLGNFSIDQQFGKEDNPYLDMENITLGNRFSADGAQSKYDLNSDYIRESVLKDLSPVNRLATGQPRSTTSERITTGQRRTTSRMAPQSYMTGSNVRTDEEQEMQPLSFLGQEGAAFAEGYNIGVKKRNYARRVWQQHQQDLQSGLNDLIVKPSGINVYDSSVEQVSEEKVNEMAELMSQRGKIPASEWTKKYNQLKNWAEEMNLGSKAIKESIIKYASEKDQISTATNPKVQDIYNTIERGASGLTLKNTNGVTTLTGTTTGEQKVSIPFSNLAGINRLNYIKKVDTEAFYSTVLNGDGKNKKGLLDNKTWFQDGITAKQRLAGYNSVLGGIIDNEINEFLNNENTIRAIAAEKMNKPYDVFEHEFKGDMSKAKQAVSEHLKSQLKARYANKQGLTLQVKKDPAMPPSDTGSSVSPEQQRQDLLMNEAARIVGIAREGTQGEDAPRGPNYNLLLGRKGVGRVEKEDNNLVIYGKRAGSSMAEDELKTIPLQNAKLAAEIIANFLSEDKTYNPRGGSFNAAEYINNYNQGK